jgi:hypothetical protein
MRTEACAPFALAPARPIDRSGGRINGSLTPRVRECRSCCERHVSAVAGRSKANS